MPLRFEMGTLVDRARKRADKENDDSIPTAEWKVLISEVYGQLWQAVTEVGSRYFESESTITADGSESYDEPTDMLSFVTIDYVATDGRRRSLRPLRVQEQQVFAGLTGAATRYALIDDQIWLYPKPTSGTYKVKYVPQRTDLSDYADDDIVDVVNPSGEAFLIWGTVVLALAKAKHDVTLAAQMTEKYREELMTWAIRRELNNPTRQIVDDEVDVNALSPADWRLIR